MTTNRADQTTQTYPTSAMQTFNPITKCDKATQTDQQNELGIALPFRKDPLGLSIPIIPHEPLDPRPLRRPPIVLKISRIPHSDQYRIVSGNPPIQTSPATGPPPPTQIPSVPIAAEETRSPYSQRPFEDVTPATPDSLQEIGPPSKILRLDPILHDPTPVHLEEVSTLQPLLPQVEEPEVIQIHTKSPQIPAAPPVEQPTPHLPVNTQHGGAKAIKFEKGWENKSLQDLVVDVQLLHDLHLIID